MKSERKLFHIEFDLLYTIIATSFKIYAIWIFFYVIVFSNEMNTFHLNGVYEVNKQLNTHYFDI